MAGGAAGPHLESTLQLPHFVKPASGEVDVHSSPATSIPGQDGNRNEFIVESVSIMTTDPNEGLELFHNRWRSSLCSDGRNDCIAPKGRFLLRPWDTS